MASKPVSRGRPPSLSFVGMEGFLYKKRGLFKSWSRKYFILNKQSLVYFKREKEASAGSRTPQGRLFLSDIVKIDKETMDPKKQHVFTLRTKKRAVMLSTYSAVEKESWLTAIEGALMSEGEAERKDPFRRTLRRLAPGLKRVTLMKDPVKGIGCTIKSAAGHIFVNRIIEDGPIAHTGVLRPDDELLDVNGVTITGMTVAEVGKVIYSCPDEFLATVRPITTLKRIRQTDVSRVNYVTVLPNLGSKLPAAATSDSSSDSSTPKENLQTPMFVMKVTSEEPSSEDSLDDVGNYDDEDELSGAERSPTPPLMSQETAAEGEDSPMSPSMPVDAAAGNRDSPTSPPSSPVATLSGGLEVQRRCNYTDVVFTSSEPATPALGH